MDQRFQEFMRAYHELNKKFGYAHRINLSEQDVMRNDKTEAVEIRNTIRLEVAPIEGWTPPVDGESGNVG